MKKIDVFYGVAAIIIFGGILWYVRSQNVEMPSLSESLSHVTETKNQPSIGSSGSVPQTDGASKPAQLKSPIKITAPAEGAQWITNENHTIAWTKEAGITGSIYLADAETGQTVGWILSTTGMHQTSFTWNTSDIFTSRGGGLKKPVQIGRYIIKIKFDGTAFPEIRSGTFSIVYAEQIPYITYTVAIKNYALSPTTLSVKSGDTVVFTNTDSVVHHLTPTGFGEPYTLQPNGSATLNTKNFVPGSYGYYSPDYTSLKFTVIVK